MDFEKLLFNRVAYFFHFSTRKRSLGTELVFIFPKEEIFQVRKSKCKHRHSNLFYREKVFDKMLLESCKQLFFKSLLELKGLMGQVDSGNAPPSSW